MGIARGFIKSDFDALAHPSREAGAGTANRTRSCRPTGDQDNHIRAAGVGLLVTAGR
jgi:hypothetical protein